MNKNNFQQKFNTITNILILSILIFGSIAWADTNGVWNRAEDVKAGVFAQDENGGDFTFPNNLYINENLCINGECHSNWESICESWIVSNAIN